MKYIIIIFTTLVLNHLGISQDLKSVSDYYYQLYQGKQLLENGKPDSACIVFENAFKKVDYIPVATIRRSILQAAKESKNKELISKYRAMIKGQKKCPPENKHIWAVVDSISKLDQNIRSSKIFKARQYYQKYKSDTVINKTKKFLKTKKINDIYVSTDSSNIICMLQLIDKYGYIGEQMIGYNNNFRAYAILLHFDTDTNNVKLSPFLRKALLNNEISPLKYALIIDRHLYSTSEQQMYWTWFMIDDNPNLSTEKIKEIMMLREQIGLWGTEYSVFRFRDVWMLNNISRTAF